jgi:undecaprenyl-phosphate 4-deoxy-4-formamido-L-arabinose transferase
MNGMDNNKQMPSISAVIPVFNSEDTLEELYLRLTKSLIVHSSDYEIIFINDASGDNSSDIIYRLAKNDSNVVCFDLAKNYGQHNALLCGIRQAKYEVIVTLDDDLQNPPEEIPYLLEKLDQGYDVVYGYPKNEQHELFRNIASVFTKIALKTTMGISMARHVSAFRVFRTELRNSFSDYKGSFISIDVLLSWGTNSFSAIPVNHEKRVKGKSNYTFRKLVRHAVNMVTGFSVLPLQIASMIGFLLSLFGFVVLVYVVGRFLFQGSPVPGFPFLASIIAIFSGAQLLGIGIIGEYLARMHFRTMDKPQYFIKKTNKTSNY